uniref:Uncharacterized protein n=1 Tax=viral metagenome TaxID=1070528 RepID=A0A6M3KEY7_9ZZZZ
MDLPRRHASIKPKTSQMSMEDISGYIMDMPDDVLSRIQFSVPWQYSPDEGDYKDADGFSTKQSLLSKEDSKTTRDVLQIECWDRFHQNPQINTSVWGKIGRLTGMDFGVSSDIWEIQQVIEEIELDPRNRLYNFWPKFVGRSFVEGELFLVFTVHPDGFVEVDFIDPAALSAGGDENTGIIFHPNKPTMPLFYIVSSNSTVKELIPSIFIARYPDLVGIVSDNNDFKQYSKFLKKDNKRVYDVFNGYQRFVISWDRGFLTKRAISYLRTIIQWCNHYETLKKYEIDYKKSAGSYVWAFTIENPRDFKLWLTLPDEEKRKTGIMAKKTPGSSLVLPPGMKVEAVGPKLPSIREEDTDIMHMVSSGLNEPEDVTTGVSSGTFASVKASRGPWSDRISDELAYFKRFLQFDFWGSIFFLRSNIGKMEATFSTQVAVGFKNQKPIFKKIKRKPEMLLEFSFPASEVTDFDSRAKGLLGVKHGPVSETLGIPQSEVAKKLGIGNYGKLRLKKAEEDEKYPELIYAMDAESLQEKTEAEPGNKKTGTSQKKKETPK